MNWNSKTVASYKTYRQVIESDMVAAVIVLLQGGAKITDDVWKAVNKESFFAKGVPRTRVLKVLQVQGLSFLCTVPTPAVLPRVRCGLVARRCCMRSRTAS